MVKKKSIWRCIFTIFFRALFIHSWIRDFALVYFEICQVSFGGVETPELIAESKWLASYELFASMAALDSLAFNKSMNGKIFLKMSSDSDQQSVWLST